MKEQDEVLKYQKQGHTFHCATRIVFGDGECECNLKAHIPGGISRAMYYGCCAICLNKEGHKDWCKHNKEKNANNNPRTWTDA